MMARDDRGCDESEPPTFEEARHAAALRDALDGVYDGSLGRDREGILVASDLALLRSLRLAYAPSELDVRTNERLVRDSIRRVFPFRRVSLPLAGGVGAVLALTASVALLVSIEPWSDRVDEPVVGELILSRSTQPLFSDSFGRTAGASQRMDLIALERSRDYRFNRLVRWGVHP